MPSPCSGFASRTTEDQGAFRELAMDRIRFLIRTFAKGDESAYRFTCWDWKRRFDWIENGCATQGARMDRMHDLGAAFSETIALFGS